MSPPTYHRYPPMSRESYRDLLKVLEGQQVVFPQRLLDIILLELGLYPNEDLDEVIVYDPHCMTRRHHDEPSSSLHHKSTNCEMRDVVSAIKQLVNEKDKKGDYFSEDILESILGWLCPADYLRCRAVCSWWRTVIGNAIRSKHCKATLQLPLLMLNFRPAYDKDSPCFYSLSKQKLQFPNKPIYPVPQNCIGSIDGWLIMYDKDSMNDFLDAVDDNYDNIYLASFYYFLNPVSDDTVPLCGFLAFPNNLKEEYPLPLFHKMVASTIPTDKYCCVAGLSKSYLAYGRVDDKPWALLDAEKFIHDIEIHDGKLYVVISSSSIESIMVYDFQLYEDYSGPKAQKLVVHEVQSFLNLPTVRSRRLGNIHHIIYYQKGKLVKDTISRELFLVVSISDYTYDMDQHREFRNYCKVIDQARLKQFTVFKVDLGGVFRLVEMDTLKDRTIFLSLQCGSSVILPDTSLSDSQRFLQRNCIYFSFPHYCSTRLSPLRIGIFSLDDKNIKFVNPESDLIPLSHIASSCWFIPML